MHLPFAGANKRMSFKIFILEFWLWGDGIFVKRCHPFPYIAGITVLKDVGKCNIMINNAAATVSSGTVAAALFICRFMLLIRLFQHRSHQRKGRRFPLRAHLRNHQNPAPGCRRNQNQRALSLFRGGKG